MPQDASDTLILNSRRTLSVGGVTDLDRFDEKEIRLFTRLGELTIRGQDLHIQAVSVETGCMDVEGDIWCLQYGDRDRTGPLSLLGRLFR